MSEVADMIVGEPIPKDEIEERFGRGTKYKIDQFLQMVQPNQAVRVDPDKVSVAGLRQALKDSPLKVITRDNEKHVFVVRAEE